MVFPHPPCRGTMFPEIFAAQNICGLSPPAIVLAWYHCLQLTIMLFRRRKPASLGEKIREFFWPRKGFARSFRYVAMRIARLSASPHAVAVGVASGVVSACTPFVGFHLLIALGLSYVLAGNLIAAALGSAFANPLTVPIIWAATYEIGTGILGTEAAHEEIDLVPMLEHLDVAQLWQPVLKPMLVGAVPLAAVCGFVFYVLTFFGVGLFQKRRKDRRLARAHLLLSSAPVDRSEI